MVAGTGGPGTKRAFGVLLRLPSSGARLRRRHAPRAMIIDFHNHYYPHEYLDAIREGEAEEATAVAAQH